MSNKLPISHSRG